MHRILLICLLLIAGVASAQPEGEEVPVLTIDSLGYGFDFGRFQHGDNPEWARPDYDDSEWRIIKPWLWQHLRDTMKYPYFNSIGWFRFHFIADSSITGRPLAMQINHLGASEIYLDGRLIKRMGRIQGDSTIPKDPQSLPFTLVIPNPGEHVVAVRYANYDAQRNYNFFHVERAGISLVLSEANSVIQSHTNQVIALSFVLILLFGLFLAMSLLHFFMYLYNRDIKSNAYFSLFSLSLALGFLIPYLMRMPTSPTVVMAALSSGTLVIALGSFSLSGFVNELFSSNKTRFRVITLCCLLVIGVRFIHSMAAVIANVALMSIVALEAVILIVGAMIRKVKGARIIGAGVLLLALFFLSLVVAIIFFQQVEFNDSTLGGKLAELLLALAVLSLPISMSIYLAWNFAEINKSLKTQLEQVKLLSEKTLQQEQEKKALLEGQKEQLERDVKLRTAEVIEQKQRIEVQHEELKAEKKKSDDLLRNILPEEVAEELKQKGSTEAKHFDHVSVLFTDFVNFTRAGEQMTPKELVHELHTCFKAFDEIILKYGIEKIKTIGDAYLAVSGLPVQDPDHAIKLVYAALDIRAFMEERRRQLGERAFLIRIGIHSGPVVAGIVGVKKFAYDIWGDTVNTAARMEQASEAGRINISQSTYELVAERFECSYRGEIAAKHKGSMKMYFVEGARAQAAMQ